MVGQTYGQLTILEEKGKKVQAACVCGIIKVYWRVNVLGGKTLSCGCYRNAQVSAANTKHGHRKNDQKISATYRSWLAMKKRCDNPLYEHYDRYGGRGITYQNSWSDFTNFLFDMGERPEGLELDREDNNGNYTKDNCRWTTHKDNCNNRGY